MEQKDKELLFKDLCGRLPYGVYVKDINKGTKVCKIHEMKPSNTYCLTLIPMSDSYYYQVYSCDIDSVRSYLRPMSSMTEEEAREIAILHGYNPVEILSTKVTDEYIDIILDNCDGSTITSTIWYNEIISSIECFDYLNKNMFDFRGLIPKDLALSTEEFNPYKE